MQYKVLFEKILYLGYTLLLILRALKISETKK